MIFDSIKRLSQIEGAKPLPGISAVRYFLDHTDIRALPAGKHPIGAGVYVAVNCYEPKPFTKYEGHRNYIDLQYMVDGDEDMLCADLSEAEELTPYDPEKDVFFCASAARSIRLPVHGGDYAVFFPDDIHAPGIANEKTAGEIRKLVFKLPVPEYELTAHLIQLSDGIGLSDAAKAAVLETAEKITAAGDLSAIEKKLFAGQPFDDDLKVIADACGISRPLCSLTAYMIFARTAFYRYLRAGVSPEVYFASMRDFTIWEKVCEKNIGEIGLLECGWLAMSLRGEVLRFGRLQFEPSVYHGPKAAVGGVSLTRGMPVINVHIPEDGRLEHDLCIDAYRRAQAFFADRFADGAVIFTCDSWLLYPAHYDFLPKTSNILRFMNDFTIVVSRDKLTRPKELWRIFGFVGTDTTPAELPRDTGLQRAYADHLAKTGRSGDGYGVFVFDGKTFSR